MFKMYHYTTWPGGLIWVDGVIRPSADYSPHDKAPPLVWVTKEEFWEPCIQAYRDREDYVRQPSSPVMYRDKAISCWKFEVEVPNLTKVHYNIPGWIPMLEDAKELGSDVTKWAWGTEELEVVQSFKWYNRRWREVL